MNPLPSHHMGGLMPQIRARQWQAPLVAITPELMKSPGALLEQHGNLTRGGRDAVISLVPTQLQRLLGDPSGCSWLQQFRLLWIGGGPLSTELADQARQLKDEVDILRETADKVEKYEASIESYKKKMEEQVKNLAFYICSNVPKLDKLIR